MLLKDLLAKINEEVKYNPKVLDFEVWIDQYHSAMESPVEADYMVVHLAVDRSETSNVTIG